MKVDSRLDPECRADQKWKRDKERVERNSPKNPTIEGKRFREQSRLITNGEDNSREKSSYISPGKNVSVNEEHRL